MERVIPSAGIETQGENDRWLLVRPENAGFGIARAEMASSSAAHARGLHPSPTRSTERGL
jgi:hypothetical protein